MSETQPLPDTIYFIELPKQIDLGQATLLPEIPIPVEVEQGESFDVSRLRPEMIVSAMLRVLSAQPEHEHADYYRQIVRVLYPNVVDELSREGIMRAHERDFGVAERIFSALAGFDPEDARHALNLAVLYEDWAEASAKSGDNERESTLHEKANSWYERLLQWEPPLDDAYYNAAYFYAGQRDFERAMSLFTTFISLTDDNEKRDKARVALEKLKERSSSDDLFKEAFDAIRLGNEDKSIALVQEFIKKEPGVWNAWFLLGWAYRRKGRFEEGFEALERAVSLGADMVDVYNEYSICAMELGKYKECRKHLELALRLEPENTKIISNLGVLAKKTGNLAEARGFFETVLEFDPSDQLAAGMLKALKE